MVTVLGWDGFLLGGCEVCYLGRLLGENESVRGMLLEPALGETPRFINVRIFSNMAVSMSFLGLVDDDDAMVAGTSVGPSHRCGRDIVSWC